MDVLVIDDGSTDETPEVCARYAGRIRVIRGPNAGVIKTLGKAFSLATGDYVCPLDADDYFLPGKLNAMVPAIREGALHITHDQRIINTKGETTQECARGENTSTLCIHRESALTLFEAKSSDMFPKPLADAGHGRYIHEVHAAYRIHPKSHTDRSPTSKFTEWHAQAAHSVANRLEQIIASPDPLPAWAKSRDQLTRIARRYRAEGLMKDWERALELPGVKGVAAKSIRALWAEVLAGRKPDRRHPRFIIKSALRHVGINIKRRYTPPPS